MQDENRIPAEERDFFYLCERIGDFCKAFGRGVAAAFTYVMRISYRHWALVLLIVLLGVGAGLYYSRRENRKYKVEAVALLNGVSLDKAVQLYSALQNDLTDQLSKEQNLANLLKISEQEAKKLSNFKYFYVIDVLKDGTPDYIDYKNSTDKTDTLYATMSDRVALQFRTKDLENVPNIEKAILNYFNSQPACMQAFNSFRENLNNEKNLCKDQIEKLQALSAELYSGENVKNSVIKQIITKQEGDYKEMQGVQVQIIGKDLQWHFDWLTKIEKKIANCSAPVQLVDHFVIQSNAINGRIKCTVAGLILGWLLGIIIATIIEKRKNIVAWLKG